MLRSCVTSSWYLPLLAAFISSLHKATGRLRHQHTRRGVLYENTNRYTEAEQDYRWFSSVPCFLAHRCCLVCRWLSVLWSDA